MRLAELAELVGENTRQIRYLIAEGFVPAPNGISSGATYGQKHERAVRRYQKFRSAGMRPGEIKLMLAAEKRMEASFSPGVVLLLDPGVPGWIEPDAASLAAWAEQIVKAWLETSQKDSQHAQPIEDGEE